MRPDILCEIDGPMLRHGLQGLEDQRILVPSRVGGRPDVGRLGVRWEEIRKSVKGVKARERHFSVREVLMYIFDQMIWIGG